MLEIGFLFVSWNGFWFEGNMLSDEVGDRHSHLGTGDLQHLEILSFVFSLLGYNFLTSILPFQNQLSKTFLNTH